MHRVLLFMAEPTLACASNLSKKLSHLVFSDVFVPYSVPVAPGTNYDDLPTREFIVEDVRVFFFNSLHIMELTVLSDWFSLSQNQSGSIVARLQTPQPATVARAWYLQ